MGCSDSALGITRLIKKLIIHDHKVTDCLLQHLQKKHQDNRDTLSKVLPDLIAVFTESLSETIPNLGRDLPDPGSSQDVGQTFELLLHMPVVRCVVPESCH